MPLGLEEQFAAVNTATQFARLSALDSVWTGYLQSATPAISDHDVEQLRRITDEMTQLLREAPDRAGYLNYIVDRHTEELENEYARVFENDELSEKAKIMLRDTVEQHGGIVDFAKRGANRVLDNSSAEREAIETKISIIQNGGFSAGDLSPQFLCGLASGIITGGLFARGSPGRDEASRDISLQSAVLATIVNCCS